MKFFFLKDEDVQRIKRFQYPAIDDCTRISALKIYEHHNQTCDTKTQWQSGAIASNR